MFTVLAIVFALATIGTMGGRLLEGPTNGWQDVGLEKRRAGRWLKPFLDRLGRLTSS
jgi:hypothetical protein